VHFLIFPEISKIKPLEHVLHLSLASQVAQHWLHYTYPPFPAEYLPVVQQIIKQLIHSN
jgi:hypothetical protein